MMVLELNENAIQCSLTLILGWYDLWPLDAGGLDGFLAWVGSDDGSGHTDSCDGIERRNGGIIFEGGIKQRARRRKVECEERRLGYEAWWTCRLRAMQIRKSDGGEERHVSTQY